MKEKVGVQDQIGFILNGKPIQPTPTPPPAPPTPPTPEKKGP